MKKVLKKLSVAVLVLTSLMPATSVFAQKADEIDFNSMSVEELEKKQ